MKILTLSALMLTVLNGFTQRDNLYPYSPDGKKWGAVDEKIHVVIRPLYESEFDFGYYDHAVILKKNKYGIINKKGIVTSAPVYDSYNVEDYVNGYGEHFEEGIITMKLNGKSGIASLKKGHLLLPAIYDKISFENIFSGFAAVQKSNKWGIVNIQSWRLISKVEFDEFERNTEIPDLVAVKKTSGYGMIHEKTGAVMIPFLYDGFSFEQENTNEGQQEYIVLAERKGAVKKININKKVRLENTKWENSLKTGAKTQYGIMAESSEKAESSPPDRVDYIKKIGEKKWEIKILKRDSRSEQTENVYELSGYDTIMTTESFRQYANEEKECRLKVIKDNKTGLISPNGRILIPILYDDIDEFHNGFYKTKLNNLYGIIKRSSFEEIKKPVCKSISNNLIRYMTFRVEMPGGETGRMDGFSGKIYIPGVKD
jgi:WG containing repeat